MTEAQRIALEAVEAGQVLVDGQGHLVYDGKAIHGNSLASCRKRGWVEVDIGRLFLTVAGHAALSEAKS
jgi:hypothetical protein